MDRRLLKTLNLSKSDGGAGTSTVGLETSAVTALSSNENGINSGGNVGKLSDFVDDKANLDKNLHDVTNDIGRLLIMYGSQTGVAESIAKGAWKNCFGQHVWQPRNCHSRMQSIQKDWSKEWHI